MKKVLPTRDYLEKLFELIKSGDMEKVNQFKKEYSDCKIERGFREIRNPIKNMGIGVLDDDPF